MSRHYHVPGKHHHHVRVFKIKSCWPWRLECECGQWQQGDKWRPVFDWAFEHVKTGKHNLI